MKPFPRAAAAALAALCAGCTTVTPAVLPDTVAARLAGQNVAIVIQAPAAFNVMHQDDVPLGPLGLLQGAPRGARMRADEHIADPADDVATALADALAGRQAAVILSARGSVAHDAPSAAVAAAPPGARYVLTVATLAWGLGRFPMHDAEYAVAYMARARLVDAQSGAVVAEAACMQPPDGTEVSSKDYDRFVAAHAQLLKTELGARVDRCVHYLKRDLLGP